eukprot:5692397-Prymnesium_polylepis.1
MYGLGALPARAQQPPAGERSDQVPRFLYPRERPSTSELFTTNKSVEPAAVMEMMGMLKRLEKGGLEK